MLQPTSKAILTRFLAKKLDVFIIIYLDNILIYTNKANHFDCIWYFLK